MKVLVTGVTGQLGFDVVKELKNRNISVIESNRQNMDITNFEQVRNFIIINKPDALIHCSAYTAVDNAEEDRENCENVNVNGTENIVKVCAELNIKMIYISTDYVFKGDGENFWNPDDEVCPLNFYGLTKYKGELAVKKYLEKYFIVRISWVYGINGKNFVKTMLNLAKTKNELSVVNDQIGSPTYTYDLAKLLVDMVLTEKYGVYNVSNEGVCSWYDLAVEIFKQAKIENINVIPVTSDKFPSKSKRPKNSRMNKQKLIDSGFDKLPDWKDALSRFLKELGY